MNILMNPKDIRYHGWWCYVISRFYLFFLNVNIFLIFWFILHLHFISFIYFRKQIIIFRKYSVCIFFTPVPLCISTSNSIVIVIKPYYYVLLFLLYSTWAVSLKEDKWSLLSQNFVFFCFFLLSIILFPI